MSDGGDCGTALATPGLLKRCLTQMYQNTPIFGFCPLPLHRYKLIQLLISSSTTLQINLISIVISKKRLTSPAILQTFKGRIEKLPLVTLLTVWG